MTPSVSLVRCYLPTPRDLTGVLEKSPACDLETLLQELRHHALLTYTVPSGDG
jgi:hypothetical protein